jgi:glycosyltransferase involved in cell wall biosynthesis
MIKKILLIDAINARYSYEEALNKPIGGSELAFCSLMHELEQRDDVELFTWFVGDDPPAIASEKDENGEPILDHVISLRAPLPLLWVKAKHYNLWTQDYCSDEQKKDLEIIIRKPMKLRFIFLSHAQRLQYIRMVPAVKDIPHHMWDNGIHKEIIEEIGLSNIKKEKQFIYASHPVRGLEALIDAWPIIHQALPDYTLVICGGCFEYAKEQKTFKFNETYKIEEKELYDRVQKKISNLKGIIVKKALSVRELYKEIAKSAALLYPNTLKIETSCTILHQALYCGTVPIVSCMPCMPEFIVNGENGFVLWENPLAPDYYQKYAQFVIATVQSDRLPQVDKVTRGKYLQWHWDRLTEDLMRGIINIEDYTTTTEKVLLSVVTRTDRGDKRGINWWNLTWMDGYQVQYDEVHGFSVDQGRELAASKAVFGGADWILFLDDDVFVDNHFLSDMVERARKHNADIVTADYFYKTSKPYSVTSIVDYKTRKRIDWSNLTEEEVNDPSKYDFQMSGLGATLISVEGLKKIGRPWFRINNINNGALFGEDFKFFQDAKAVGLKIWFAKDIPAVHKDFHTGQLYGRKECVQLIGPQIGIAPMKPKQESVMSEIMRMYDNEFNVQKIDIRDVEDIDWDNHPMRGKIPDDVLKHILEIKNQTRLPKSEKAPLISNAISIVGGMHNV